MFSSVSALKIGYLIMPFDEFKLLCSVTSTGTPKKEVCFFQVFSLSFPSRFLTFSQIWQCQSSIQFVFLLQMVKVK